ncbi:MAG: hypothetical protein CM15mP81_05250 [Alphaproteobacteria bacterium]|nr:MAG: hypothetical protein CM15mP81_05250 [Alphaproteobacteria bacterium]
MLWGIIVYGLKKSGEKLKKFWGIDALDKFVNKKGKRGGNQNRKKFWEKKTYYASIINIYLSITCFVL